MLHQRQRLAHDFVQIHGDEFRGRGAREIQQRIDDLAGAEGLPRDFFEQRRLLRVARNLLGQHLRVGGNHRQRRVDFMRDARRQQPDGAQLVGLHQPPLQLGAVGDVVEDDQAADARRRRAKPAARWRCSASRLRAPAARIYKCCERRIRRVPAPADRTDLAGSSSRSWPSQRVVRARCRSASRSANSSSPRDLPDPPPESRR